MQCILCNKRITLGSKENFSVNIDNKNYCLQCSEVLDFGANAQNRKIEKIEKIQKIEKPKIMSNSFWFCRKCKVKTTETACLTCKLPNPLCR